MRLLCRQALADGNADAVADAELSMTAELMRSQFGDVVVDRESRIIRIEIPGNSVTVELGESGKYRIACGSPDASLHARVEVCLVRLHAAFERFGRHTEPW